MKATKKQIIFTGVLTVLVFSTFVLQDLNTLKMIPHYINLETSSEPKIIVDWTGHFCEASTFVQNDSHVNDAALHNYWHLTSANWCPNLTKSCLFTGNRSFASSASAILFHVQQIGWSPKMIPPVRHAWQRYIMHTIESPPHTHLDLKDTDDLFNWTMTYRRDSDIPYVYGYVQTTTGPPELNDEQLRSLVSKKRRLVAWFVSNCKTPSKREDYVKELQKYIQVDIYGPCGPLKCQRGADDLFRTPMTKCLKMLKSDYLFYVSFENSVCDHYVTEKLYSRLNDYVVPLVLRGSDYNQTGANGNPVAPPNSYIAVDAFENPKQLADYLKWLSNNTEEYLKYFEWRKDWSSFSSFQSKALCDVCEKLYKDDKPKSWSGLHDWWWGSNGSRCEDKYAAKLI